MGQRRKMDIGTELRGIGMTSQRTRERLVQRLIHGGISELQVLEQIRAIPRHLFVDEALASRAYEDTALPIGFGQTISQPFIVARMTQALLAEGKIKKVLEVGTGSGYQTAVLAGLVNEIYSVERIRGLLNLARERFRKLNLSNIHVKYSDGGWGWPEQAPFDGIIVTAAPLSIPETLIEQLAIGGRLVIPVGDRGSQQLKLVVRTASGYDESVLEQVRFVSFRGGLE